MFYSYGGGGCYSPRFHFGSYYKYPRYPTSLKRYLLANGGWLREYLDYIRLYPHYCIIWWKAILPVVKWFGIILDWFVHKYKNEPRVCKSWFCRFQINFDGS